jgi:hypothetical protein
MRAGLDIPICIENLPSVLKNESKCFDFWHPRIKQEGKTLKSKDAIRGNEFENIKGFVAEKCLIMVSCIYKGALLRH